MRKFFRTLLIFSLLSFDPLVLAREPQPSPTDAADQFYRTLLDLKIRGLPTREQMKVLSPLLSPDLKRLFDSARVTQDKFRQAHPEEKPPWVDGDLFTSLFEGAQSYRVGRPSGGRDRCEVPITLTYREGGSTTQWSDVLVIVRDKNRWLVWDIMMKGEWAFKKGESLRSILSSD